jgi:hypothetical protein
VFPKNETPKSFVPLGTKQRRTAAGPQERPAAAAAAERGQQAGPPDPAGEWQRQADDDARRRAKERQIEVLANGLQIPAIEVMALMRGSPDELRQIATEAGVLTPEGKFVSCPPRLHRRLDGWQPRVSVEAQQAIRAGIEELSDSRRLTPEQATILANVTKATKYARQGYSLMASTTEAGKAVA